MAYILLWVFFLIATLAWFAAALATPPRVSNIVLRIAIRLLLASPPIAAWGWLVTLTWETREAGIIRASDAWTVWTLATVYIAASVYFFTRRWWRRPPPPARDSAALEAATAPATQLAHETLRRRTVAALYGLALISLGMHVFTLFILKRAVVGTLEAALVESQAAVQVQLEREKVQWADIIARRTKESPGEPPDAVDALNTFAQTDNDAVNQRRQAMLEQMWLWRKLQGEWPSAVTSDQRFAWLPDETVTAADGKCYTLQQSADDFRQELADLRAATHIDPPNAIFDLQRFDSRPKEDLAAPRYLLSDYLALDGEAAVQTGDLTRAAKDLAAIARIMHITYTDNWGGTLYYLESVILARRDLAEAWLSSPDLQPDQIDRLALLEPDRARRFLPVFMDLYVWNTAKFSLENARKGQPLRLHSSDPFPSYSQWLDLAYWMPNAVQDEQRKAASLRPLLTAPYPEVYAQFEAPLNWPAEGLAGSELRRLFARLLDSATSLDTREDLLRVAQAAARYRLKHGRYPETLDKLAPEFLPALPPDRFTGKPLLFRVDDNGQGLALWSVGPDRFDNQAAASTFHSDPEPDLTFFLGAARERALERTREKRQQRMQDSNDP